MKAIILDYPLCQDDKPPEVKMKTITSSQNHENDLSDSEPGNRSSTKENFQFSVIDISLKEPRKDTYFNTGSVSQTENLSTTDVKAVENNQSMD